MTDHGNMFGALQLYKACKETGIVPILGCEVNVARPSEGARDAARRRSITWCCSATTEEGYREPRPHRLAGHVERAERRRAQRRPGTRSREQPQGLVALTGCMGGVVAQQVLEQGEDAGLDRRSAGCAAAFEPGSLFVELQDHGLVEQPVLNGILVESRAEARAAARRHQRRATTSRKEDADAQLYLTCAQSRAHLRRGQERGHHGSQEMYLKSADEMAQRFRDLPEAMRRDAGHRRDVQRARS